MFFKCLSSSLPSTSFFVSFTVYPKLNVVTKCRVLFRPLYLTENQSWKKLLHGTQPFFSALPNVLPLFVLPLSSTAQWCGLEGRAARRSADQSAIHQQSAILHRNRQALPSTSLSIKSARCRKKGTGDENESIFNVQWGNDSWPQHRRLLPLWKSTCRGMSPHIRQPLISPDHIWC